MRDAQLPSEEQRAHSRTVERGSENRWYINPRFAMALLHFKHPSPVNIGRTGKNSRAYFQRRRGHTAYNHLRSPDTPRRPKRPVAPASAPSISNKRTRDKYRDE